MKIASLAQRLFYQTWVSVENKKPDPLLLGACAWDVVHMLEDVATEGPWLRELLTAHGPILAIKVDTSVDAVDSALYLQAGFSFASEFHPSNFSIIREQLGGGLVAYLFDFQGVPLANYFVVGLGPSLALIITQMWERPPEGGYEYAGWLRASTEFDQALEDKAELWQILRTIEDCPLEQTALLAKHLTFHLIQFFKACGAAWGWDTPDPGHTPTQGLNSTAYSSLAVALTARPGRRRWSGYWESADAFVAAVTNAILNIRGIGGNPTEAAVAETFAQNQGFHKCDARQVRRWLGQAGVPSWEAMLALAESRKN